MIKTSLDHVIVLHYESFLIFNRYSECFNYIENEKAHILNFAHAHLFHHK